MEAEIATLSALQLGLLVTLIMGITELITRLRAKDYWVAATIVCAAIVGGLVALYYSVDFLGGVTAGLSASGLLKGLSVLGNKSVPTKSDIVAK